MSSDFATHLDIDKFLPPHIPADGSLARGWGLMRAIAVHVMRQEGVTYMWSIDEKSVWMKDVHGVLLQERHDNAEARAFVEARMALSLFEARMSLPSRKRVEVPRVRDWDKDRLSLVMPADQAFGECCSHNGHWTWIHIRGIGRWYLIPYSSGVFHRDEPCTRCMMMFLYANGVHCEAHPLLELKKVTRGAMGVPLCRHATRLRRLVAERNDDNATDPSGRYWTYRLHNAGSSRLLWRFHAGRGLWDVSVESDPKSLRFLTVGPMGNIGLNWIGGLSPKESGRMHLVDALIVERNLTERNAEHLAELHERIITRAVSDAAEAIDTPSAPKAPEDGSVSTLEARVASLANRMDTFERRMGESRLTFRQARTSLEGRLAQSERELADLRKELNKNIAKTRSVDESLSHVRGAVRDRQPKVAAPARDYTRVAQALAITREDARGMREALATITAHAYNEGEPLESRIALIREELHSAGFSEPDD